MAIHTLRSTGTPVSSRGSLDRTPTALDRRGFLRGGVGALAGVGVVGAAALFTAGGAQAAGVGNVLSPGQQLNPGERITSPNGQFFFIQQGDGNAVLYTAAGAPLWSSGTNGRAGAFFANQTDGNLVLYTSTGPAWASGTNGRGAGNLVIQDDGNLVLYTGAGPTWASGTNGGRPTQSQADKAVTFARAQIGKPYSWGATGLASYDCSGLTWAAYNSVGVSIGRTTYDQVKIHAGSPIAQRDLRAGDLVFPYANISHVGIYSGNNNIIHAPGKGRTVTEAGIWAFYTARRVL